MRRTLAILALSTLAAGCTVTTDGVVVAAPTLGRAPKPLRPSALVELLLGAGELDTIMGSSSLKVIHSGDKMYTNHTPDDDCVVDWVNAHEKVYAGTGWSAMRRQELREDADDFSHIVFQAVVSFPGALEANDFYAEQISSWAECNNRRINEKSLNDPDDPDSYWTLAEAGEHDGLLSMSRVAEGGGGWSCQRALTAANNVVIDVDACAEDISDQAAEIVKEIAKKVSEKE